MQPRNKLCPCPSMGIVDWIVAFATLTRQVARYTLLHAPWLFVALCVPLAVALKLALHMWSGCGCPLEMIIV